MYLLPAVLVHAADLGVIMQQQLAAVGVSSNHGAVIEGRQPPAVLVVRGSTQVQQCLKEKDETQTIPSVEVTHTFSGAADPSEFYSRTTESSLHLRAPGSIQQKLTHSK